MHTIEIDEDVMTYLRSKAEAFVDTPNAVLRRELLGRTTPGQPPPSASSGIVPDLPAGTPRALEQILQVVHVTRNSRRTRAEATHLVAKKRGIAFQTVLDKYTRQIGLRAAEFDALVRGNGGTEDLSTLLKARFPGHARVVDTLLV